MSRAKVKENLHVESAAWLHEQRHVAINLLLWVIVVLGPVALIPGLVKLLSGEGQPNLPAYAATYAMALILLIARRIKDAWRALGLLLMIYAFAVYALLSGWLAGGGRVFLLALVVVSALLLEARAGFYTALLSLLTYAAFALAFHRGWIALRTLPDPVSASPILVEGVGFGIAVGIVVLAPWFFNQALAAASRTNRAVEQARELLDERATQLETANALLAWRTEELAQATASAEAARREAEAEKDRAEVINRLNDRLRGEQDVPALAANVIHYLCEYLGAPVGAFYVQQNGVLERAAGYACTPHAGHPRQFGPGEGLLGQAVLDRRAITVTDVPEGYLNIASGLGRTAPRSVLILPLVDVERTVGAIEIGTLTGVTASQTDVIEDALENVAIALTTALARSRIDELLRETQRQAEALQAQEEEMRATNEELEAQADHLRLSDIALRTQQAELEATNADLEEKTAALEESSEILRSQKDLLDRQNRELTAAHRELASKAEELSRASRYKSEFLANMSHELRTPLNSLLILARLLAENEAGNLSPDQVESAHIIYKSGSDLLALINEVLDLSKVEAGKMTLHLAPVALEELAASVRSQFAPLAQEKGLDFQVSIAGDLPLLVVTDEQRVAQIVRNLLANAFKFTESGSVRLRIERPEPGVDLSASGLDANRALALRVSDSGIGIAPEQQATVFEAFQQVDGSTARQYGGTGLGLTISRQLAAWLGGQIGLQSTPGQGSTFTLYLPLEVASRPADDAGDGVGKPVPHAAASGRPAAVPSQPVPATIPTIPESTPDDRHSLQPQDKVLLIVEDDLSFAQVVQAQARRKGFKCLIAADGPAGLALVDCHLPDAVVLDLKLPGMSGWQVLDALKQNPNTRHVPVHIVSALEDDRGAYKRGAIGFLTKPVSPQALDAALQRLEQCTTGGVKSLLLVEDDATARHSVRTLLEGNDVSIYEVSTGQAAIDLLRSQCFDCMILDLQLPDMSGFTLLDKLDADEAVSKCPILVYTGRSLTEDEHLELMRYADSVIVKGVKSPERLLDETSLFLHRVVADMPEEKQRTIRQLHDVEASLQGKHVLIVDDDMRSAFALSHLLGERGLKVNIARSGPKALELLESTPSIDLVLMDIMMPEMDGYEATRRIRAHGRFRHLPILALTAKAMKGDEEKCIAAGANDYLSKPVDADRLLSMLRVWLYR